MRYGAGILKWNTNKLKSLDRRTRTFMTMHVVLHPTSDMDRVYLSREMGGRGLITCGMYKDGKKQLGMLCQEFI